MFTNRGHKVFLLVALVLALALLLTANTSALAQRPSPSDLMAGQETSATPSADPNTPANLAKIVASSAPVRVIVQLKGTPVAEYTGGVQGLAPTKVVKPGAHLDAEAAPVQAYSNYLSEQQDRVAAAITSQFPSAEVQYKYGMAFNGFTVKVPGNAIPTIRKMSAVRNVSVEREYELDMDSSLQLIGLYDGLIGSGTDQGLWTQKGGHANAGKGVKVADIDSGIDQENPFFNPSGFRYPFGFPKGDHAFTTPKVIAARAFFRPDDPPNLAAGECACPRDVYSGHGSHTAGTMSGRFGTLTPYDNTKISGIAPKAWLMNYKVFYHSISGSDSAYDPELLQALEWVIKDGADVVNNSWGGTATNYVTDPLTQAFQAATDTGLVVVFSAGNNGPSANSIGTPGAGEKVITVGASTTNRIFGHDLSVVGGDNTVTGLATVASGPAMTGDIGPLEYVDSASLGNSLGCAAFPAGAFTGKIALISRGTCTFSTKINNAVAAGAVHVVIINNTAGWPVGMSVPGTTVTSFMVSDVSGAALKAWVAAHPGAQITIGIGQSRLTDNTLQDWIASFSSRGPTSNMGIKPDLTAPGVNILSSYAPSSLDPYTPEFELLQGTSMAAPHVTGLAALLHQRHPSWTPEMYKSALVNTAVEPSILDKYCLGQSKEPITPPQCRGAGRVNAQASGGAADPGLLLSPVSLSLGVQFATPTTISEPMKLKNVAGVAETYNVTIVPGGGDTTLHVSADASVTLAAHAETTLNVEFETDDNTTVGDHWGEIKLDSSKHHLHMMYWVRVLEKPTVTNKGLLLIDDDESINGAPDYRSYYTGALDAMGVAYDVFETDYNTCVSPWNVARLYDKVIWFSGDSNGFSYDCDWGLQTPNITGANLFFANGGRLLATGQYIAAAEYYGNGRNGSATAYPNDLVTYFGAQVKQENVFGAAIPAPSAEAVGDNPFLGKLKIDFSSGSGGAGNQTMTTELDRVNYSDSDTEALFTAYSSTNVSTGAIATRKSSEPTLERTRTTSRNADWDKFDYRTVLLNFGLEGVNQATRKDLLGKFLNFLGDDFAITNVTGAPSSLKVNKPLTLNVTTTSTVGAPVYYYRIDWGVGDPYITTNPDKIQHVYTAAGTYKVRVEATDIYGHKSVWPTTYKIVVRR